MKNNKGNMLLIELVIVIFFFSLSQVVIVQVFQDAQSRTANTSRLNKILIQAENAAERLAGETMPDEALLDMGFRETEGLYVFQGVEGVELLANVRRLSQLNGELVTVDLTAKQGEAELFTLPSVQYFASEVPQNEQ